MFISAFKTNAMTSDFLSSISPGWVVMFLDSHLMVFTFLSWLDLLGVALAFRISILNIFNLLLNYWRRVTESYITSFEKHSESSFGSSQQTKEGQMWSEFVSSGSKIVKRLRRRKYDPLIIERTIGLVLGPYTALYRSFLKHCTLTNKAVVTIWRDLSKPPKRTQGPDPRHLWLLVGTLLVLRPELASRRAEHSHSGGCLYIFLIKCFNHLTCLCNNFMVPPHYLAVGPRPL